MHDEGVTSLTFLHYISSMQATLNSSMIKWIKCPNSDRKAEIVWSSSYPSSILQIPHMYFHSKIICVQVSGRPGLRNRVFFHATWTKSALYLIQLPNSSLHQIISLLNICLVCSLIANKYSSWIKGFRIIFMQRSSVGTKSAITRCKEKKL